MVLEKIKKPNDIKKLQPEEFGLLAEEIRSFLIEKISETGGHLASNLGVVELTMALHLAFDLPEDKLIWDVGHQAYTHKLLTGRKEDFGMLRQHGGISGFPKRRESDCDAFDTGHSSTSISAGLGLVCARDLMQQKHSVVSVIGDGSMTGGMAYEAMNNAATLKTNFIIVLNDNNMSISENVGGISRYLTGLRTNTGYNDFKEGLSSALSRIPVLGDALVYRLKQTKSSIKQLLIPGMFFEEMGITYLGPVDGHNIQQMMQVFQEAKKVRHAVLVHVLTKKGKGYRPAEMNPSKFHGVSPFHVSTGKPKEQKRQPDYTDVFSDQICRLAAEDERIVAVTAAMPGGTGLSRFAQKYPKRFFDVGIAEGHAVTFAAGMAAAGLRPVFAVYSSFLQRGFDQILHDVCIQNLPVLFAVDRAGLVGCDGETHQGIFDLSYLTQIPNLTVMAPKNGWELGEFMKLALELEGPAAVRYPRGPACMELEEYRAPVEYGRAEVLEEGGDIAFLAVGSMVETAMEVHRRMLEQGKGSFVVNLRFAKPFDKDTVRRLAMNSRLLVTMEENVHIGGLGEQIAAWLSQEGLKVKVLQIALPDAYVEHGNVMILREENGIDAGSIMRRITEVKGEME
ncbi:1-deoxy-D-xylulose-5-phosphate synthase [Cuneatibacter caecimuris]|uniref:1-deoxy-D-xylulose-5-phosphate synthase n=1 Tax=Cuneatibacter caecimuris TaxID=1796618 RepID=A0A4Q7NZG6_9FIRM|nr:1-deoxy-D-xylulose-5-phosphate synthase [Cuneatibacter caecimuris]RZS92863.1 1-deoxy-D-xylulose-5-phosphate synthase [Cuneatibacter caecimuris]